MHHTHRKQIITSVLMKRIGEYVVGANLRLQFGGTLLLVFAAGIAYGFFAPVDNSVSSNAISVREMSESPVFEDQILSVVVERIALNQNVANVGLGQIEEKRRGNVLVRARVISPAISGIDATVADERTVFHSYSGPAFLRPYFERLRASHHFTVAHMDIFPASAGSELAADH